MKSQGWFFAEAEIFAYRTPGLLFGQVAQDSCVAACCRMILGDHGISIAESYLRDALQLDEGSYVSLLPALLRGFGLATDYVYRNDLTLAELTTATWQDAAVAFVKTPNSVGGHALVVDGIADGLVKIRDPLPQGHGKAYSVTTEVFLKFWLRPKTNRGLAVIVLE